MAVFEKTVIQTPSGTVELHTANPGAPKTLVLVHASATGPHSLFPLVGALEDSGISCVIPALPGYGDTIAAGDAPGDSPTDSVASAVTAVCATLETLGTPASLFGHSFGGLVALEAAKQCPVEQLVVFEPIVLALLDVTQPALADELDTAPEACRLIDAGKAEEGVRMFTELWNDIPWSATPAIVRERLVRLAPVLANEIRSVSALAEIQPDYSGIDSPTLILDADRSPAMARQMTASLARHMVHAEHQTLLDASHMAPVMQATRAAPAIAAFLDQ